LPRNVAHSTPLLLFSLSLLAPLFLCQLLSVYGLSHCCGAAIFFPSASGFVDVLVALLYERHGHVMPLDQSSRARMQLQRLRLPQPIAECAAAVVFEQESRRGV